MVLGRELQCGPDFKNKGKNVCVEGGSVMTVSGRASGFYNVPLFFRSHLGLKFKCYIGTSMTVEHISQSYVTLILL